MGRRKSSVYVKPKLMSRTQYDWMIANAPVDSVEGFWEVLSYEERRHWVYSR
jgi:hypothetical protein